MAGNDESWRFELGSEEGEAAGQSNGSSGGGKDDGLHGAFSLETALKRDDTPHDILYKIIIIGAAGVGKTNLLGRWIDNKFAPTSATLNVELATKSFKIDGLTVKVQLWDTAGQEQYKAITRSYYRKSHGAIIVYDVTRKDSFAKLDEWIQAVREETGNENTQLLLVGNKTDLEEDREVSTEDGIKFARDHTLNFLETSAYSGSNVHRAFQVVLQDIHKLNQKYAKLDETRTKHPSKQTVKLTDDKSPKKPETAGGCCNW